ncbi:MAG: DivIVA domain-containing protein [Actinomycetia bacterium]|nr:DivIVA domain-containing protein [Actinomycetes bacterium]
MALSISRPDPSSPAQVSTATFTTSRKGFDSDEVREFLRMVAAELARLQDRETLLENELRLIQQTPPPSLAELDEDVVAEMLGDEATRIVGTARETASQIKTRAEESASRLLIEANEEAQRVRAEAEIEAGRRRQDASLAAEDELQMAKQQGRDMVNEARAYRERVLGELARRREVARKQIEQLIHHRDRLMQSFERSRVIAVDVIAELAPQAAGAEFVDIELPKPTPAPKPAAPAAPVVADKVDEAPVDEARVDVVPVDEAPADVEQVNVGDEAESDERDVAVEDLFARLRAASEPATGEGKAAVTEKAPPKAKPKAKAKAPKKTAAKEAPKPAEPAETQLSVFLPSPEEPEAHVAADDSPFGRRDAQLAPLVAAGSRNLKRVLADEQNDVLLRLRGREAVRSLVGLLPTVDEHVQRYADAIVEELMHAAVAGAAGIDDGSLEDQRAKITRESALTPAIEALATAVVSPLRDRLERSIAAADGDNTELVGLTRTVYREWKMSRIDEHIDDVVRMAFGRGALAVLRAGTPVCWAVDPRGPACPDAEDNALAGEIGAGSPFPTEHISAPAHEGCRCMLLLAAR